MNIKKITIGDKKFAINLKFYFLLKHLVKTNLTEKQVEETFSICQRYQNKNYLLTIEAIQQYITTIKGQKKKDNFLLVIEQIQNDNDLILFVFSLKLF